MNYVTNQRKIHNKNRQQDAADNQPQNRSDENAETKRKAKINNETKETQKKRFKEIKNSSLKRWKFTAVDSEAQKLWTKYTKYKDEMFEKTNKPNAPWNIISADKKMYARTEAIKLILQIIPYDKSTKIHSKEIKF